MFGPFPQKANLNETQVVATLVFLLFGIPALSWDAPTDHFECFVGEMEVTKAEWRVFWLKHLTSKDSRNLLKIMEGVNIFEAESMFDFFKGVFKKILQLWTSSCRVLDCKNLRLAERPPFDIRIGGSGMNLLTNEGFANALYCACNLKIGAGHMTAPVCSTWVFMCHV